MESYSFFPRGKYAHFFSGGVLVLAVCLMLLSGRTRLRKDSFACLGLLGSGSPASFICDYSEGEAPVFDSNHSKGLIDLTDFPYLSPQGVIIDLLFYSTLILLAWFLVTYSVHLMRQNNRRIP